MFKMQALTGPLLVISAMIIVVLLNRYYLVVYFNL